MNPDKLQDLVNGHIRPAPKNLVKYRQIAMLILLIGSSHVRHQLHSRICIRK